MTTCSTFCWHLQVLHYMQTATCRDTYTLLIHLVGLSPQSFLVRQSGRPIFSIFFSNHHSIHRTGKYKHILILLWFKIRKYTSNSTVSEYYLMFLKRYWYLFNFQIQWYLNYNSAVTNYNSHSNDLLEEYQSALLDELSFEL